MTADPAGSIERLRERVETSAEIADADREALLAFSDRLSLLRSEYSDQRHEKLLGHVVRMAEGVGGLADALEDRGVAERVVRWINRHYDNEETNKDYRIALRVFGKRVTEGEEPPASIAWVPSGYSSSYDPAPEPREMLRWDEHVVPMIEETRNSRDAALVAVAWDSGARPGELQDLSVGDVTDHDHGLQITVDGKRGRRTVTLIPSVPHLQRWLADHPVSKRSVEDDPDAPLWSKLSRPEGVSNRMLRKALRAAADRAGVTRPVTLTNFRKSSASYLASQGMNQAHIEDHHGWTRGSEVAARYVAVFGEESDREIARVHGVDLDEAEERDPIAPRECPRCGRETPRDEEFCVWCNQALDRGAIEELEEREQALRSAVLKLVREDPGLLDEVERVQQVMTVFEERPGLHDDAEAFIDALREG